MSVSVFTVREKRKSNNIMELKHAGRGGLTEREMTNRVGDVLTIDVPVVYMARDIMILMRENPISRAIGRCGP